MTINDLKKGARDFEELAKQLAESQKKQADEIEDVLEDEVLTRLGFGHKFKQWFKRWLLD